MKGLKIIISKRSVIVKISNYRNMGLLYQLKENTLIRSVPRLDIHV